MKNILLLFSIIYLSSCANNNDAIKKSKHEVIDIVSNYVSNKFSEPKKEVSADGTVIISEKDMKYEIDPNKIIIGYIDEDDDEDALISIASQKGLYPLTGELLILLGKDGKFTIDKAIESNMKILELSNRNIIAEISTMAQDSPLYGCKLCIDTVCYQFRAGELIQMENKQSED